MKKLLLSISALALSCFQLNAQAPNLVFSNSYASTGNVNDEGKSIKHLRNGKVAVAGRVGNANPIPMNSLYAGGGYVGLYNEVGGANWVSTLFADFAQIATDAAENIYVVGSFTGNQLSYNGTVLGSVGTNTLGSSNIVVAKYSVTGALLWIKAVGSSGDEFGTGIAVEPNGDIYLTGRHGFGTGIVDFEPGNPSASFNINGNAFLVKLTTNGNYVWHKTIPLGGYNYGSLCIDENNVYLSSQTYGTQDMNAGGTPFMVSTLNSSFDIVLLKYRKNGTFVTAKTLGGCTNVDYSRGLEVKNGKLAMFGAFATGTCTPLIDMNAFIPGAPTVTITSNINTKKDGFIAMYDTNFVCQWAKAIGGPDVSDEVWGGAFDNVGNFLISGQFCGTNTNFNLGGVGTFTASSGSATLSDYFYGSYNVATGNCNWIYKGGSPTSTEIAYDITCDSIGRIWSTGYNYNGATGNDMFINKHFCALTNTMTLLQNNPGYTTFTLSPFAGTGNVSNFGSGSCLTQASTFTALPNPTNNIKVTIYDINNNLIPSSNHTMSISSASLQLKGFKLILRDTITNCEKIYNYQISQIQSLTPAFSLSPTNTVICQGETINLMGNKLWSGITYTWMPGNTVTAPDTRTLTVNPTTATTYTANISDGIFCVWSAVSTVSVSLCTGLEDVDTETGISIYPNPTNGLLFVDVTTLSNNSNIELFDIMGRVVLNKIIASTREQLDISNLNNGVYFLKIVNGNAQSTSKIIKQ